MKTTILIADDHRIMREGLGALLGGERDLEVVGEAPDGREAVRLARELKADVVIMDVGMPGLNGVEATKQIAARAPDAKVLALSMHSDRRFVTEMLRAGAYGYVLKESAFEEVVRAVREVVAGRTYLSPGVVGVVVEDYVSHVRKQPSEASPLTDREREVVQLLAEGESTKRIAARLNVSVKTIETHRKHVMEKLDIHSVAELTKYAVREGLTPLES